MLVIQDRAWVWYGNVVTEQATLAATHRLAPCSSGRGQEPQWRDGDDRGATPSAQTKEVRLASLILGRPLIRIGTGLRCLLGQWNQPEVIFSECLLDLRASDRSRRIEQ